MLATGRISGVLLPLFSLRSRTDFGIGDFGSLDGLFEWMRDARQKLLMLLPLLPTAPGDASPYSTRSAFGLNPLFIDLARVPEFAESGGIDAFSSDERQRLEQARASARIQYDLVFPLKAAALRRSFERFEAVHVAQRTGRARTFEGWCRDQRDWLEPFALFMAISQDQGYRGWWEWPEPLRDRQPEALERERGRLGRELTYQSWLQWIAECQWTEVRARARKAQILLCGDEPFIISMDSADSWANPTLLRRDARLGVPPDAFSATGQDWGLPYFDFKAMEADDYAWIRFRARKAASYYDLRRVDHAVGYFRQWIRDEQTPTGRFVPVDEPEQRALGERMFRLLSKDAGIVAEDLGVIPTWVRQTLAELHLPGYRVLRWERDDNVYRNPREFPALSLATTGTHDTETLREWWEATTEQERDGVGNAYPDMKELLPLTKEWSARLHEGLLRSALNSGSDLCVLPWQDVFGLRERVNLPGTMSDANWAYRITQPAEELLVRADTRAAATFLARLTAEASR